MNSEFVANVVFLIHLVLVGFVTLGWLIPGFFYFHLILILATLSSEIFFGYCLLTRWEFGIRKKNDPTLIFDKSCMVHYIRKWQGLEPRPVTSIKKSFFKRNNFVFILLLIETISIVYNFL